MKNQQPPKKNGNSNVTPMPNVALAPPAASAPEQPGDVIMVKPEDQKLVREFDQELAAKKMELAGITVQIEVLKGKQRELIQKLLEVDKQYFDRISKIGTEYGLDMQNTKWNFDAGKMAFSKMA